MVLVGLADIAWVLLMLLRLAIIRQLSAIVQVVILLLKLMILGLGIAFLLGQLLDVLKHDFHVGLILSPTFPSIDFLRDQGCISLTSVRAIIARVCPCTSALACTTMHFLLVSTTTVACRLLLLLLLLSNVERR